MNPAHQITLVLENQLANLLHVQRFTFLTVQRNFGETMMSTQNAFVILYAGTLAPEIIHAIFAVRRPEAIFYMVFALN